MTRQPQERISRNVGHVIRVAIVVAGLLMATGVATAQTHAGDVPQTFHVLYTFTGGEDGGIPFAGLLRDGAGNLYGTAEVGGGIQQCNCGVVFRVSKSGIETVLFTFTGDQDFGGPDGSWPAGDLVADKAGNLYGTTTGGGNRFGFGDGVVFQLDSHGTETVLHSFNGDGSSPLGLIRDAAGNLYGVTPDSGGGGCCGLIYRVDNTGKETPLYSFSGGADGEGPSGDLLRDAKGNLYGTAGYGGAPGQYGVVFKLSSGGKETVLHTFTGSPADGSHPLAGLLPDGSGNAYGTTYEGGSSDNGTVFKIDSAGNETIVYSFTGGADGGHPEGGLARDSAGNLYGTTSYGGSGGCKGQYSGCGVVFRLDPTGKEHVLHSFTGGADGAFPGLEKLALDKNGNLYGTTTGGGAPQIGYGVVFAITP